MRMRWMLTARRALRSHSVGQPRAGAKGRPARHRRQLGTRSEVVTHPGQVLALLTERTAITRPASSLLAVHDKAARDQGRRSESLPHDVDSFCETNGSLRPNCIKSEPATIAREFASLRLERWMQPANVFSR